MAFGARSSSPASARPDGLTQPHVNKLIAQTGASPSNSKVIVPNCGRLLTVSEPNVAAPRSAHSSLEAASKQFKVHVSLSGLCLCLRGRIAHFQGAWKQSNAGNVNLV